jgi:hypothetical protein
MSLLTAPDEAIPLSQMFSLSGKVCLITGGNRYVILGFWKSGMDRTWISAEHSRLWTFLESVR